MATRPERKILWGLVLAILAIGGTGAVFFAATNFLIADAERLEHTHAVISTLADLYTQVREVRFSARGYAVNEDDRFVQHYNAAAARCRQDLDSLHALAAGNPTQTREMKELDDLFARCTSASEQLIHIRRAAGFLPSIALIRTQIETELEDPLRERITKTVTEQREQLVSRGLESQNSGRAMLVLIIAGSIAELLVALAAAFAIRRYIRERQRALDALTHTTTKLENQSRQLETARQAADAANRAKSAFLANMSHEIRTPVTAILGYADLVLEPNQTASDRHDSLQTIRRSARHLLDLINDILDLSKIEAGRMNVESIPCDPAQIVTEIVSMIRPRAEEKHVTLNLEFQGAFPNRISSDPLRLRQILVNLLGNAIKFTDHGAVTVRARCSKSSNETAMFEVEVSDTGIGMSAEQMSKIFAPFTQADQTTTRRFGGSGLGLSISKRLAEMLGGDITVQSELGKGSTFTLNVSAGDLSQAHWIHGLTEATFTSTHEHAKVAEAHLAGHILLVEDGKDNQRLISTHLRRAGAEVIVADNGRIAVELVMSHLFDLVLMDMQMPELDGYGAARQIRELGHTMPIIALTAHAMSGDRDKCLAAGCTDYLTKPIEKNQFLWTIASHLSGNPAESNAPLAPAAAHDESLQSEFADDVQMTELVAQFINDLPPQVGELNELLEQHRIEELRRLVHQLKGAGGGYGFTPISAQAARAEHLIKSSAQLDQVQTAVHDLVTLVRKVEGYQPSREKESCLKKC